MRKSVRRATPDGDGEKKRQKSLPAPSPDALFRLRARFSSILGSRPGPKIAKKRSRSESLLDFFAAGNRFFAFSSLGRVPEGSRTDSGGSGGSPGSEIFKNFTIFFCRFLRFFFAGCVPIFSGFVGFAMLFCRLRVHLVRVYQAGHLAEAWREFPWGPW